MVHADASTQSALKVVLISDDEKPLAALQSRLAADAVENELASFAVLRGTPAERWRIVIACLSPPIADRTLEALGTWSRRAGRPLGLIGYLPEASESDAERALVAGFDDCIVGRDSPRELSARVRAVGRRLEVTKSISPRLGLEFGKLSLDLDRHELIIEGVRTPLTRLELLLIKCLIETAGRPVRREELLTRIWGADNVNVGLRAVDNLIWRLRRKIGPHRVFAVVRGVGFQLLR